MPFFTAAIAAVATFFSVSTAVATFAISTTLSIGLSYAAKALSGNSSQPDAHFSLQGTLKTGGTVPRSFNLGYSATAGSLVYANTWSNTSTPNAFFTQVIALADLPGGTLVEVWIDGARGTLGDTIDHTLGAPVLKYRKNGADNLWIKFYDGTQTAADDLCVNLAASADRPYPASRIGTGIAYAVCTAHVDDTLFTGFPAYKFALSGLPLYDPSRDDSVGGNGSHRWNDRSTWGGDGDQMPAVQIYNILRGFTYNGTWLYGLQDMVSARLPASNWIAQIQKCRVTILGENGQENTYRSGGQVNIDAQPANAIEAFLTACQGRISEIGGFYKIRLGAPDSATFSWTDADLLSTEEQTYKPFFGLADSINGITASYPFPAEGWNSKVAPPYYRSDLETRDGSRRLLANPAFDFVPYSAQVQRLMRSALDEAQRARTHVLAFPPQYWIVEPGDIGQWSSFRNGYVNKLFRADAGTDNANLDVILHLTEVDPSDYSWDHNVDFQGVPTSSTAILRPAPQGIRDWSAVPSSIIDANGFSRRPAILLGWDGTVVNVSGVQFEVRNAGDSVVIYRGRTDNVAAASIIITQALLPNQPYQVRGQYIPTWPRDMLWSDWLNVTTPDIRFSISDFDQFLYNQVTVPINEANARINSIAELIASVATDQDAANHLDKHVVKTEIVERASTLGSAIQDVSASVTAVTTTATGTAAAFASYVTTVNAHLGTLDANVSTNATSIVTTYNALASYTTTTNATISTLSSSVTTNATSIVTINGKVASSYTVILDSNNYVSSLKAYNDGSFSSWTFVGSVFQIAFPANGLSPRTVFQVGTVNGSPAVSIVGNLTADGAISARTLATASITAGNGAIDALAVKSLNIQDNAVTVPVVQFRSDTITGPSATVSYASGATLTIDTAGLAGKQLAILVTWNFSHVYPSGAGPFQSWVYVNGDLLNSVGGTLTQVAVTLAGTYLFNATGGVMSFPVQCDWYADSHTILAQRVLSATAVKR